MGSPWYAAWHITPLKEYSLLPFPSPHSPQRPVRTFTFLIKPHRKVKIIGHKCLLIFFQIYHSLSQHRYGFRLHAFLPLLPRPVSPPSRSPPKASPRPPFSFSSKLLPSTLIPASSFLHCPLCLDQLWVSAFSSDGLKHVEAKSPPMAS